MNNENPETSGAIDLGQEMSVEDLLLNGGLSKRLGLDSSHLEIGLEVARNKLNSGAHMEAFRMYGALVLCEPTNVKFQIGLANCAAHMHEHHVALQAASVVVALDPTNPTGYFLSGNACLALGHLEEAIEDLTDASKYALERRDPEMKNNADALLQKIRAMSS